MVVPVASRVATLLHVIQRGSGFSCAVETGDGRRFVMKLSGAGQGAAGNFTELIATRLARAFGLLVPDVEPLWLDEAMPWRVGTDEFDDALLRSAGWNLGIRMIDGATDLSPVELPALSEPFLRCLAAVDAALDNIDRTAKNPNLMRGSDGRIWAIDFGACLYHVRDGQSQTCDVALPPSHFLAQRFQAFPLPVCDAAALEGLFADVPSAWSSLVPRLRERTVRRFSGFEGGRVV